MFRFLVWWRKFHFYRIILDWKNTLEKRFKKKIPQLSSLGVKKHVYFLIHSQKVNLIILLYHLRSEHQQSFGWYLYPLPFGSCAYQDHPMATRLTSDIILLTYIRHWLCITVIKKLPNICKSVDIFHMFYKRVPLRECILWCASCLLISASS